MGSIYQREQEDVGGVKSDWENCNYRPWSYEEDKFRRKLKYFFMNSVDKFYAKRRMPCKVILQIVKVFIVTYMLIDFGHIRSLHIDFIESSNEALRSFYMKDWSAPSGSNVNPPSSSNTLSYYTIPEFYQVLNYVINRYYKTEDIAIGNFNFATEDDVPLPVEMCIKSYAMGVIYAFNQSFHFNSSVVTDCFPVIGATFNSSKDTFDAEKFLSSTNRSINFDGLINVVVKFSLMTVHLKSLRKSSEPDCYRLDVTIDFDNSNHDGEMDMTLDSDIFSLQCQGDVLVDKGVDHNAIMSWLTLIVVISICFISAILCVRSFFRALKLQREVIYFFDKNCPSSPLTYSDKLDFIDAWYILIFIDNVLILVGCIYKICIETKISSNYEHCGLLLGTGNLLCWIGLLRYLALFKAFKIFIVTLKKASPTVLKFLVCAFFIFLAFSISGWIVLGPYHSKFREFTTATECLYSLMNGDDLYTTFAIMEKVSFPVWLYSRIYLFGFISLFIYVIMSMFITIIADVYQEIKDGIDEHKSRLHRFADECAINPCELFQDYETKCKLSIITKCFTFLKNYLTTKRIKKERDLIINSDAEGENENTFLYVERPSYQGI